jgi:glyoxylase-like metal-dependent hydrolase (beta-lactamase superfamily II)
MAGRPGYSARADDEPRTPAVKLEQHVAEGIHRVEDAHTNWYLVEEGSSLTVVDTGLPRSWRSLRDSLRALGRRPGDIEAVVLTHAHFDHMGFARRAQQELGVPLWAHSSERSVVAHPWRYEHERSRLPYLRHPGFLKVFAEMTAMGALAVQGTDSARSYDAGAQLEVPGHPQVLFTPGHTHGHCSLLLRERGALIVGDAFVMLDPYTGRAGPCIVAGAATADSNRNLASLDALGAAEAEIALTGHGPVWRGNMADAVAQARATGPA